MFDMAWGHQAQQLQQQQQQQPPHTPRHDDTLSDFFADPDFKWIANTIFTPPRCWSFLQLLQVGQSTRCQMKPLCCRPSRGATFDPLASPASPGNWMLSIPPINSNMPFSPAQAVSEMHSRTQQRPAQSKANSCVLHSTAKDTDADFYWTAALLHCSDSTLGKPSAKHCISVRYQPHVAFINVPALQ